MTDCLNCGELLYESVRANGNGNDLRWWCDCGYERTDHHLYPHHDPTDHRYKHHTRADWTNVLSEGGTDERC